MADKIENRNKDGSLTEIKVFDESGKEHKLVYVSGVRYKDESGDFWTSYDGINFRKDEFFN